MIPALSRPPGEMASRLTTNQEIAGSTPAVVMGVYRFLQLLFVYNFHAAVILGHSHCHIFVLNLCSVHVNGCTERHNTLSHPELSKDSSGSLCLGTESTD